MCRRRKAPHPDRPSAARSRSSRRATWRSSRRRGAATSRARPISSRKCCASTATTISRRCRCRAKRRCRARRSSRAAAAPSLCAACLAARGLIEAVTFRSSRRAKPSCSAAPSPSCASSIRSAPISTRCGPRCCRTCSTAARRNADRGWPDARCSSWGRTIATTRPRARYWRRPGCAPGAPAPSAGTIRPRPVDLYQAKADALAALAAVGAPAENVQIAGDPPGLVPPRPRRRACGSGRRCWHVSANCTRPLLEALDVKGRRSLASRSFSTPCRCRARGRARPPLQAVAVPAGRARFRLRRRPRRAGRDAAARRARRRPEARRRGAALRCL